MKALIAVLAFSWSASVFAQNKMVCTGQMAVNNKPLVWTISADISDAGILRNFVVSWTEDGGPVSVPYGDLSGETRTPSDLSPQQGIRYYLHEGNTTTFIH